MSEEPIDLMDAMRLSIVIHNQGGKFANATKQRLRCDCSKTFVVPYTGANNVENVVVACAHCDSALGWPRFKKGLKDLT